jgi:t-SNARE complex subunit (syntaxin)
MIRYESLENTINNQLILVEDDLLDEIAHERYIRIIQIANDVNILAKLFHDVNQLVILDGINLNKIEENIDNVKQNVETAQKDIKEAHKISKKNILLIGGIITLISCPTIGVLVGIKAGIIAASGMSVSTIIYNKIA